MQCSFGTPDRTWCLVAGCGWCWAPASLVGAYASVSKAVYVLWHWHSEWGCGASCSGGCSTCLWRHLGWRGRGFEMGNSAAPPPGSSAGNTAHPQTHGSTKTKSHGWKIVIKMWHFWHFYLWICTVFVVFIAWTFVIALDADVHGWVCGVCITFFVIWKWTQKEFFIVSDPYIFYTNNDYLYVNFTMKQAAPAISVLLFSVCQLIVLIFPLTVQQ